MHQANAIRIKSAHRRNRIGLTAMAERRLRVELRRTAPSEPWVDAQFIETVQMDERGKGYLCRLHDPGVFPPGGAHTRMVRCPECGAFTPPFAMEGGICLDHAEGGHWGPSPSAQGIAAVQWYHMRMPVETELASESVLALQKEIHDYKEKGKSRRKRRKSGG